MTTGLYDENFFNNPARVTANPESRLTLLQLTPEVNTNTINAISSASKGLNTLLNTQTGNNLHQRVQMILPAYYSASHDNTETYNWSYAFGLITGLQSDFLISNMYQTSGDVIADIGPALTIGYKAAPHKELALGATIHGLYRFSANPGVDILTYLQQPALSLSSMAGQGAMYNLDLGATLKFFETENWEFEAGLAGQNLLGQTFNTIPLASTRGSSLPTPQPMSFGVGVSAARPTWGPFQNSLFALEVTDILNNGDGSVFRLLHLGGETHWKFVTLRAGLNQGYWTAGLGLRLLFLHLDLASYGEELGLNVGQIEDRRYALSLGINL
jgi:hypothetical protein